MSSRNQPDAPRHAALKAQWQQGQRWETLVEGATIWVPVGGNGYTEPTWDGRQKYRQMETS